MSFAEFWELYPRRQKKLDALKAWNQTISLIVTTEDVLKGTRAFRDHVAREGTSLQFVMLPATFLRSGAYMDEYELNLPETSGNSVMVGETMSQAQARWARENNNVVKFRLT